MSRPGAWRAVWGADQPGQVFPLDDLRDHGDGDGCWCAPKWRYGVLVHVSADGRERRVVERGELVT